MRKAGELAARGMKRAMATTKPGVNECLLESVFEHSVKSEGAQWMSFPPVVAGGDRATCLHYIANNRTLQWAKIKILILYSQKFSLDKNFSQSTCMLAEMFHKICPCGKDRLYVIINIGQKLCRIKKFINEAGGEKGKDSHKNFQLYNNTNYIKFWCSLQWCEWLSQYGSWHCNDLFFFVFPSELESLY